MAPRCGKPMRRYEAAHGPILDDPACGRPAGHDGPCRTALALARYVAADTGRVTAARRAGRYKYPDRRRPRQWDAA
jgi:hypothetical protein